MCDYVCKFQIYLYIYTASLYSGENLLDSGAIHIARFWGNIHVYMNMNLGGYIYTTRGNCTICMYMYIYICKYINMYMRILDLNISLDFGGSCMSLASGGIYIFMYVHTNTCDYARILQKKLCVYIRVMCCLYNQRCGSIRTFVYVDWEICLHIREYMYIHMCGYVCMFVHTCLCLCVCVYIYICTRMFVSCEYAEEKPKMDTKILGEKCHDYSHVERELCVHVYIYHVYVYIFMYRFACM